MGGIATSAFRLSGFRSVGVCNWYARKARKEGRKDLRNLKGNTSWAKYDVVRGDKYQAQWAFVSKAPRKASQPFLSMTPSSARLLDKLPHTADRWKGKKKPNLQKPFESITTTYRDPSLTKNCCTSSNGELIRTVSGACEAGLSENFSDEKFARED